MTRPSERRLKRERDQFARESVSIPRIHNIKQQLTSIRSQLSLILAAVDDGLRRIDIEASHNTNREQAHGDTSGREHHQQGSD